MREVLAEILRLADDQTWSHAARMISIKRIVTAALADLDPKKKPEVKPSGGKAGDTVQEQSPPPAGKVVI